MRSIKRAALTAFLTGSLAVGAAAPAMAYIEYVGGGMWDYGMTSSRVFSNYQHDWVCHGSTAVGTYRSSDQAHAGRWSYASATRANSNNATYYNTSKGCP